MESKGELINSLAKKYRVPVLLEAEEDEEVVSNGNIIPSTWSTTDSGGDDDQQLLPVYFSCGLELQ